MPNTIHLGFEVGTGEPVSIPLKHMVITGQTQEAGKTTALEALISRSGLRALTFITKPGEASFRDAKRIKPYFREQADWQFVASILEASRGEKLKFERAWIIRASKGARSLADVQANVRKAMETAKGMSADVYLTLDAYLDAVVPYIAKVKWATSVELEPGINVMDLTDLTVEMQHLVIRSSIHWVLNREKNTVVVVPEAWKFIPQGRGTPVKLAAEEYIRQAAGLGNYLWLDSQDIGGIEKVILRSVPLFLLGVQRESNEIERSIKNIPAGIKRPTAADIGLLELGQFYSAWGKHILKTYVQPEWMNEAEARAIALGQSVIADRPAPEPINPSLIHPIIESETEEMANSEEILAAVEKTNAGVEQTNKEIRALTMALGKQRTTGPTTTDTAAQSGSAPSKPARAATIESPADDEAMYQRFKARLMEEAPAIFKVLQHSPEIVIEVIRPVVEMDNKTILGKIVVLLHEGFFNNGVTVNQVYAELNRKGAGLKTNVNVYKAMDELQSLGAFTIEEPGGKKAKLYSRAADLKVTKKAG